MQMDGTSQLAVCTNWLAVKRMAITSHRQQAAKIKLLYLLLLEELTMSVIYRGWSPSPMLIPFALVGGLVEVLADKRIRN